MNMRSEFMQPLPTFWWALTLAWAVLIFCLSTQAFPPDFSRGVLAATLQFFHVRASLGTLGFLHALHPETNLHPRIGNVLAS